MKTKSIIAIAALAFALSVPAAASVPHSKIVFPNKVGEYQLLKVDFHIHTLFSDGVVWPSVRVSEALAEGLDGIAITDHLMRPAQSEYIKGDCNAAYNIAAKAAGDKLIVIPGTEFKSSKPLFHWNALFLKDAEVLLDKKFDEIMPIIEEQGAFLMWNHPAWARHAPNKTEWMPISEKAWRNGYLKGVEVYNLDGDGYSPEAFQWALDKNLTIFCDTDIHVPVDQKFDYAAGEHRPVTLVFAKEKTSEGVREAIDNRRTAAYADDMIYGREEVLAPLAEACIVMGDAVPGRPGALNISITNTSSCPIVLAKAPGCEEFIYYKLARIRPLETVNMEVRLVDRKNGKFPEDEIGINFFINNYLIAPDKPLEMHFKVKVRK